MTISEFQDKLYYSGILCVLQDAVQNSGTPAQLKFSFQMPSNSAMKDMIVYDLPTSLIDPKFF